MQRLFLASCATFRDALTLGLGGSSPTTVPAPPAWPMLPACLPSATRFPPSVCQMSHLFQTVVSVLRTLSILELLLHLLLSSVRAYCCLKDVTTAKIRSGSARAACSVQWLSLGCMVVMDHIHHRTSIIAPIQASKRAIHRTNTFVARFG